MQKTAQTILSLVFLGIIVGTMMWFLHPERVTQKKSVYQSVTVLDGPRMLSPFSLTQGNGEPFTDHHLYGKWSLVFFGYTRCPGICPTTLTMLGKAARQFEKQGVSPQVVFISLDPKTDDVKAVHDYATHFNPNFIGVTGELEQIHRLSNQLGITHVKNGKLIDHTGALLVINPDGQYHAVFSAPTLAGLTHDFKTMVKAFSA